MGSGVIPLAIISCSFLSHFRMAVS
jgi:hypothetical protein